MTTARKNELLSFLRGDYISSGLHLQNVLAEIVDEIKPIDDFRPKPCIVCGRIAYYDPITERYRCKSCGS